VYKVETSLIEPDEQVSSTGFNLFTSFLFVYLSFDSTVTELNEPIASFP